MSRHTARARSGSDRTSLYDEITTRIIGELEAGRVPWVQPWGTAAAKAPLAMPKNAATGRNYSGINVLILWRSVIEHGFPVQSWITFRQALGLGGNVRKGEHGTTVVYADRFVPDDEKKRAQETGEEAQAIPSLKRLQWRSSATIHATLCAKPSLRRSGLVVKRCSLSVFAHDHGLFFVCCIRAIGPSLDDTLCCAGSGGGLRTFGVKGSLDAAGVSSTPER
jgi:hypothetical protein